MKTEESFDFSNLDGKHVLFSNVKRELFGKIGIEFHKFVWVDKFDRLCILRAKSFSFVCSK